MQSKVSKYCGVVRIRLGIPKLSGAISACGEEYLAGRVVIDRPDWIKVSFELGLFDKCLIFYLVPCNLPSISSAIDPLIDQIEVGCNRLAFRIVGILCNVVVADLSIGFGLECK